MKRFNLLSTKLFVFLSIFAILSGISTNCYSQKLTTGIMSGVNFSDIHGDFTKGKWQSKPGPVIGVFGSYSFNKIISLQTGLDYSAIYYEYRPYRHPQTVLPMSSSSLWPPQYSRYEYEKWDFSFFRIPLYLKLSTPTRLKFELAAGAYYSFITKSETGLPEYYENTSKNDFGYIFSAGFSYPVNDKLQLFLNGRYISGRQEIMEFNNTKNGATEITFGMGYSGFFEKNKTAKPKIAYSDSSEYKVFIKYKGGFNVSWNGGDNQNNSYSAKPGFTGGISLDYYLVKQFSLQTGILFVRKGFNMQDSSASFHRYIPEGNHMYLVDTKIVIDYVVIPLLMNLDVYEGKALTVFVNFGPYVGIKLNARCTGLATAEYSSEGSYTLKQVNVYDDIEGLIRNDDWGGILGVGIGIPVFKKYKLDFDFGYSFGLVNIYEPLNGSNSDSIIKNQSLQITAGFKVPLY